MATNPNDFDNSKWETYSWNGASTGALPTEPDMSSDEWDHPTAEPKEDINAQLVDLASDSERQAVYLAPGQEEDRNKNPLGSVVIEDFDGKGGKLIARDQEVADKALQQQSEGRPLQQIIGELTLAGDGKPNNQDAIVVQKTTPDGAVMRESVQATQADAEAKGQEWGGGEDINFTDMPSAIKRRKDLIMRVAGDEGLSAQLVAGVMKAESAGDKYAESPVGAQGLMQLMPGTAKDMGVDDVWDEEQNVRGGAKYLALMKKKYKGDREKMLAAYNWGPGNLDKHLASLPPGANWKEGLPRETANYLDKINVGGLSESLAVDVGLASGHKGGYAIPTDESIAGAVDTAFNKNIPYLADDPVLGQLDWQAAEQRQNGGEQAQPAYDPEQWEVYGPKKGAKKDDYGNGIKHAMMRGLLRAGQLIDLAQGDAEEYAEGAEALKDWEVSEEDAERLAELQESEGFWDALGYYVTNPALAMQVVVESLPMSVAPLAGGLAGSVAGTAAGGPVGTIIGGMTGAGLGSFATEYLASVGDALQEHGVDATDPAALRAAFANEELMATARELGRERGIGVAAWDALSMGIAGRMFKPIKALAGAAKKTGAVVGGTSEILAQATAGALGERSAQAIAGQEYDPAAVAGEFIGEIVPGVGEIAINKAMGRDAGGNKPEDTTPPPKKPKVKRNPDGSWSEVDDLGDPADASSAGDVPADVETSIPDTGDVDVDAEAADRVIETPSPESEAATTSLSPSDKNAPVKTQGETSSEVVGETDVDDMLKAAADKEDAADAAAKEADVVAPEDATPLITPKTLAPKISKTINDVKEPKNNPVRNAWGGLMQALAKRYPELDAKAPTGKFSGTGVARYLKKLQDQVDITKDLPEFKEFLDVVTTGKTADVIQALERLTSKVQASAPTLADAPIDSIAGQVQAVYNDFMEYYESHQRTSKAKRNKGQRDLKGSKVNMANKLGEMAGAIRDLLVAADDAGVLDAAGLDPEYGKTIETALAAADDAQAPLEKKTSSGGKTKTIQRSGPNLLRLADGLKDIAEKVTPLLAEAEAKGTAAKEKAGTRTKVEETSAVTEEPAKPKKPTKAENVKESVAKLKAVSSPTSEETAQAQEKGKLTGKKRAQKIASDKEQRAKVSKLIESDTDPVSLSKKIKDYLGGVDINYATVTQLRKIAKTLGAQGYSKLTRAGVLRLVQEKAAQNVEESLAQGVAQEDAEIQAEVEKQVPEKFRTGHVFHTVRSWKDIASIIKSGLNKGTNLALDIMGQGVSMLGDNGTIVLVFADNKGSYTIKDYQNDGVVSEAGMKPVAIITDADNSTTWGKNTLKKLEGIGLPIYSNGKRVATVTKKATPKTQTVTRESMGKVSKGGMSDVFKTSTEVAVEEGIARDLNTLVEDADKIEKAGGMDSSYEGGYAAYNLAAVFTGGHVSKADMVGLKQPQLRKIAIAIGAKTASKKTDLIDNIFTAAEREVSRVEAETAAMEAEKKAPKITKKPDVKGADPNEVFDKEQNIVGAEAAQLKADMDAETLDEAFEKAGVTKSAAKKIRGLMGSLDKAGKRTLTNAAEEFGRTGDTVRFAAQVAELVGKVPSPALLEAYTEFLLAINEQESLRPESSEDAMDNLYDDRPDMTEDERAIAEMTGAIAPRIDEDATVVDEYNVPLIARLKKLFEPHDNMTSGEKIRFRRDQRIMERVLNKIRDRLLAATNTELADRQGITPDKITMQELIDLLLEGLPTNHRFTHLLTMLKQTGVDMEVLLHDSGFGIDQYGKTGGIYRPGGDVNGKFDPDKSKIELVFDETRGGPLDFVKTALHEIVHAVTVAKYMVDMKFAAHIDALYMQAVDKFRESNPDFPDVAALIEEGTYSPQKITDMIKEYLTRDEGHAAKFYGLANPLEFMAEAYTNPYFQEFLATTELKPSTDFMTGVNRNGGAFRLGKTTRGFSDNFKNLFGSFIAATKKALGISMRNSVLMEVLLVTGANFDTNISLGFARGRFKTQGKTYKQEDLSKPKVKRGPDGSWVNVKDIPDKKVRTTVVNDTADAYRQRGKTVMQTRETLVEKLKSLPRAINLGFMNRDVIERNYRELFARAGKAAGHALSPLTIYIKMKQQSSNIAEKYALRATAALQKMQQLDNKTRSKVFAMMRDTTLAQVWPHVPLTHKMNAHLWTKPDKKGVSKLSPELGKAATKARKEWVALHRKDPKAAELLIEMANLTKEIQDRKRIEALRTVGKVYELDADIIKKLGALENREDIQKLFPGMYDKEGSLIGINDTDLRPADTIIVKGDSKEVKKQKNKKLREWKEMRSVAKTAEEIVKGTSINGPYFPLRRYGKYVVSSTEEYNEDNKPYVSFHNTRKEAKRVAAGLEKDLKIPTYTTKKIESMAIPRDVESVTGELASRMGSKKDGVSDYMGKRLQAAMVEIMADNTAYASQLKRHGVDGVASDDMGRAFEEYVFVAKYTLGDIATSYEVHQALKDLKSLQSKGAQDALRQGAATEEETLLIGDVVNELAAQNREDAKDREMSNFQKGVGLIGFFNFLGAPSYWILNATQTLTVTLPYIGSKWGAKGTGAYTSAAATVLKAAKGAKSYDQFKASLPPAAQKVVAELEAQGIIQSTIAHQFGDIMTPSFLTSVQNWAGPVGKATATALKLMETIPESVEKYNRISTALAIYNLSDGNMVAVADGVQATQFNYDSANRARLMKAAPSWAGGGLRAVITPMMMFKSYGIGLTRLLYGGMAKAAVGKTAAERSEARKLAGGLIVSHSVFGGVAGGMMIAPVQAIVWAFNQAFREAGDEFDPDEAVQLYLQDVSNDTVAALVSRGLPAAIGVDLSKSINLGNLIWMGNDRINLKDAGGVETMMTTALGPVAQWGVTSVREGARLFLDDPRGNWYDFAAAAIPLKMARGTIRGLKYEMEGIGTDTLTFVDPDDVTGWIRSAMGFRPTNIAMTTDFEYNEMAREGRRSERKATLVDRALKADSPTERAAVWEEIRSFNRSLAKRSDWINRGDVARLRSRRRSRQRDYNRERR